MDPSGLIRKLLELRATGVITDPEVHYDKAWKLRARIRRLAAAPWAMLAAASLLWLVFAAAPFYQLVSGTISDGTELIGIIAKYGGAAIGLLSLWLLLLPFLRVLHKMALRELQQLVPLGAVERLQKDFRAPVVYLRSFSSDHEGLSLFDAKSREEEIVEVAETVGPVITIGRPGEQMPDVGAHRMYVREDRWRDVVNLLTREARFIILRAGVSNGLLLEFRSLRPFPHKLILYFDPSDRRVRPKFREMVKELLPCPLPESVCRTGFVYFTPDWSARYHKQLKGVLSELGSRPPPLPSDQRMPFTEIRG